MCFIKSFQLLLSFQLILVGFTYTQTAGTIHREVVAGISEDRLQRYEHFLQTEIEDGRIAGAVSLISRDDSLAHDQSMGYKNLNTREKMNSDQIFYIQSMTKPIVSVAFMMLYEEGYFLLSDLVSKYLPAFDSLRVIVDPQSGADGATERIEKPVTIAHLLSHTAGFSHGLGGSRLDKDILQALYYQPQKNIESRVNTLVHLPLVGQPGEQWYYSAAPDVLALLIERFSGKTAAQFLQERIFAPLGMDDTGYNLPKEKQGRMAQVHNLNPQGQLVTSERQTPMEGNTVYGGTHGLFSTARDYLQFCRMLLNDGQLNGHQFLSRKTIELMTKNHVGDLYSASGQGFGLGFGITTDLADSKATGSIGQYYWSGAFCTYFFIDPAENLIALLMTQTAPYSNFYGSKMRQFVYQAIVD
ncbi:MAG: beta-lactamase family protein [Saprospiraceae bacterium]|nr:beta-lactamase family protein [Saprospiraceae bacterium]